MCCICPCVILDNVRSSKLIRIRFLFELFFSTFRLFFLSHTRVRFVCRSWSYLLLWSMASGTFVSGDFRKFCGAETCSVFVFECFLSKNPDVLVWVCADVNVWIRRCRVILYLVLPKQSIPLTLGLPVVFIVVSFGQSSSVDERHELLEHRYEDESER